MVNYQESIINIIFYLTLIQSINKIIEYLGDKISSRRYYVIHTLVNIYIVNLTLTDLITTLQDPLESLSTEHDRRAVSLVISLHIFHMMTGEKLKLDDWLHHILSGILVGCFGLFYFSGILVNYIVFFQCGLPGGIDYLLLSLTRYGYLDKLVEKKINMYLNMWIRMPGILSSVMITYLIYIYKGLEYNLIIAGIANLLNMINCIYFATVVVSNYHIQLLKFN